MANKNILELKVKLSVLCLDVWLFLQEIERNW